MNTCIKSWKQLDEAEQQHARDFFLSFGQSFIEQSWDDRKRFLLGPIFGHGDSLFFALHDSTIAGTLGCVTQDVVAKGEAFITEINVLKGYEKSELIKHLLDTGIGLCAKSNAQRILVGIKPRVGFIEEELLLAGFQGCYNHIELTKENKEGYEANNGFELQPLTKTNVKEYADIMTDAFISSPNGATLTVEEAMEQLADKRKSAGLLWDTEKNEAVGAYETTIIDGIGWIDALAIAPKHQALGYGKSLFRQVQSLLWSKEAATLKMTVIDANEHAYSMYLKHGFEVSNLLSAWYVKVNSCSAE